MFRNKFIEKARSVHGYKYEYIDLPEKITHKDVIQIKYNDVIYKQTVNKHLIGKCCEKTTLMKTTEQFIKESKEIWGDRFDYTGLEYKGAGVRVELFDRYLNRYVTQLPSLHLNGHVSRKLTEGDFIEISKKIGDFRYDYDLCRYDKINNKVKLICKEHGEFEVKAYDHINKGIVCSECLFSSFRRSVVKILQKRKIDFYTQYKFNDFSEIFDFYIYSLRLVIDFTYDDLDEVKRIDNIKNEYCEDNYIDIIKITPNNINQLEKLLTLNKKRPQ